MNKLKLARLLVSPRINFIARYDCTSKIKKTPEERITVGGAVIEFGLVSLISLHLEHSMPSSIQQIGNS